MKEYDSKSAYDDIKIPDELYGIVDNSINKAQRAKKFTFIKPFSVAAAVILIFMLSVNVSPVFADLVNKVPGLSAIAKLVEFDKGIRAAAENGYIQKVEKSTENNGIKFTVKELIFDRKRMILFFRVDSTLNVEDINIEDLKITDTNGKSLPCCIGTGGSLDKEFENKKYKEEYIDFSMGDGADFPEDVVISINKFSITNNEWSNSNTVEGNWQVPLELDKNMLNIEPKVIEYDKSSQIGPMKFSIKNINIYPCSVYIDVEMDKNNPYKFCGFINPRLVDKNGNEYRGLGSSIESDEKRILYFESNYFIDSRSLMLVFDGIFYIPKEKQTIEFDIKNNKVLKDPGYSIEMLYARKDVFPDKNGDNKPAYAIAFNIKDKEIIKNMKLPGFLFGGLELGKIYDGSGKKYESAGMESSSSNADDTDYIRRVIFLKDMEAVPDVIKVDILECSKGIQEKLSIKLK